MNCEIDNTARTVTARTCAHCGKTEPGWRYNRCPNCSEMADLCAEDIRPNGPGGGYIVTRKGETGFLCLLFADRVIEMEGHWALYRQLNFVGTVYKNLCDFEALDTWRKRNAALLRVSL